jgi:hypothetical protein
MMKLYLPSFVTLTPRTLFTTFRHKDLKVGSKIKYLNARCLVIDMESGVIQHRVKNGPLKELFEDKQFISDNPGCGNNW